MNDLKPWKDVSVSLAADGQSGRNLVDGEIRAVRSGDSKLSLLGRAVTAVCSGTDVGSVAQAIDFAGPGDVILVDSGALRMQVAMLGDIFGHAARRRGIAGAVVDGVIRDASSFMNWADFPVFCRGFLGRGATSASETRFNVTANIGGVQVNPGDLVIGDSDGIVIVPKADEQAVLEAAFNKRTREADWLKRIDAGESLPRALGW